MLKVFLIRLPITWIGPASREMRRQLLGGNRG